MFTPFAFRTKFIQNETPNQVPGGNSGPEPSYPPYYEDLVRWYDAEEPGGSPSSTWVDISGNQNGTVNANVTYVSGTPSYYDFSGAVSTFPANTINFGSNPFTGTTNHTIVGFVKPDVTNKNGVWQMTGQNATYKKIIWRYASGGTMRIEWEGGGVTTGISYSTNWAMVGYSFDGTRAADITAYYNATTYSPGATTTLNLGSSYLLAGEQSNDPSHELNGRIGVWLAYNRALSSSEMAEVYDYYKDRYGLT